MLKVGLGGNIGSGKSLIAQIFKTLDIPVYHSDDIAKNFLLNSDVAEKLIMQFGKEIYDKQGRPDKKKIAEIVFSDKDKLTILNNIIHPLVIDDFKLWMNGNMQSPYVIMESALLFATGYADIFDKMIFVSSPENIRINRIVKRDGLQLEEIKKRFNNQMQEKEQINKADFVIVNDDETLVIPQVLEIHYALIKYS